MSELEKQSIPGSLLVSRDVESPLSSSVVSPFTGSSLVLREYRFRNCL